MNIAVDAMGGDHAPQEVVAGSVLGAREYGITVTLVGKQALIEAELAKHDTQGLDLPIVAADQIIEMSDKPAKAVRNKPNSSIVVTCKLVKEGKAQAAVSAGHSGGALAAGIFHLGRLHGIHRPALIVPFPTLIGRCFILDVGANSDVRPEFLPQFALMGSLYVQHVMGIANPTVRILSNGEEGGKGSQLVLEAFPLLEKTPGIRFEGNAEPKEVLQGVADLVVTDGFTGNILIKTAEAVATLVTEVMRQEIRADLRSTAGALLARPALRRMAHRLDDSEYGGAELLGLAGILVVGHGRSTANAIKHSIRVAKQSAEHDIVGKVQAGVQAMMVVSDNENQRTEEL